MLQICLFVCAAQDVSPREEWAPSTRSGGGPTASLLKSLGLVFVCVSFVLRVCVKLQ
jgi:hypothetical protein